MGIINSNVYDKNEVYILINDILNFLNNLKFYSIFLEIWSETRNSNIIHNYFNFQKRRIKNLIIVLNNHSTNKYFSLIGYL